MSNLLSKTQQELLDAMRSGAVVHYMPYMGWANPAPYYFRNDTGKKCTAAAEALKAKGLAKIVGTLHQYRLAPTESQEAAQ